MTFTPRTFEEIIGDMVAYVKANTDISDFSVGSVARTFLEAAAIEDDEQYFQMTQILEAFSIFTARGEKLDRRLADFGIRRQEAKAAIGKVRFFDDNLVKDSVAVDAAIAASSIFLFDTSKFPVSGFPFTIRIAEGTERVQDISVTANDTSTNKLTLGSTLVFSAEVNDRVSLITGAVSHTINTGQQIQVPPTSSESAKLYSTQEQAFIEAGNFFSNPVRAKATTSGVSSNVGTKRVTRFVGNPPFTGAGVLNLTAMDGGRVRESDDAFLQRAVDQIPSLSRGTVLAIKTAALGVEDISTGQKVLSANIVEDFEEDEVICYIDDGTGLTPDVVHLASSTLTSGVSSGAVEVTVNDGSDFPTSGKLFISGSGVDELIEFDSRDGNTLSLGASLVNSYSSGDVVRLIDIITTSTESSQTRFRLQRFPVTRSSEVLYKKEPTDSVFVALTRDTDYVISKGTGDIILTSAFADNTQLIAHYSYYINLVALVQKVIDGDRNDSVNFPGVRAAGVFVTVEAPIIKRISVRISISAEKGFSEEDLLSPVRRSIEQYITSLGIGENVVISRIIDAAHDTQGVRSASVISPTQSILVVLENELPVPFDVNGDSLIVVV